jgi:hypothetical protein
MQKTILGVVAAALAAASIGVAAPAHALPQIDDPDPRTPFDFSGQVIELPFGFRVKFVDTDWEPGFQGVNGPRGPTSPGRGPMEIRRGSPRLHSAR